MSILFTSISVIVAGIEHQLDGNNPYSYLGHDGLGAAPRRRLAEQGAQQHGDTDLGYRLDPRRFSLLIQIQAADASDFWDQRNDLISYFAPYHAPIMKFELKNGDVRYLACYHVDDLTMPDDDYMGTIQKVAIQLKAPDPTLYDPTAVALSFNLGGGGDQFTVPTEVPTGIGASVIDQATAVTYAGNWYSQPQIRITGPITDCVITNNTTGEKLDFTGVTIGAGDYYDIDTRYGRKSVVDSSGTNKIADLTDDSDLATFHFEPVGALAPTGINSINVSGTSINSATDVLITYYNRYLGI